MEVQIPNRKGNFEGGKGRTIVKYRDSAPSCAKTAEPIKMAFELWAQIGPGNDIRWGPDQLTGRGNSEGGAAPCKV